MRGADLDHGMLVTDVRDMINGAPHAVVQPIEFDNQRRAQQAPLVLLPDVAQNVRLAADLVGVNMGDYLSHL